MLTRKSYAALLAAFLAGLAAACACARADEVQMTEEEQVCFDAINVLREQHGLPPFTFCPKLTEDSRKLSAHLRQQRAWYHGANYEALAAGNTEGKEAFRQWHNSTPHRTLVLLTKAGTEAGLGCDGDHWTLRVRPDRVAATSIETTVTKTTVSKTTYRSKPVRPLVKAIRKIFR